jgi:UDP-N-acetylmuramyl pentapeptide phosphotransferase/UDP-N-acetylglucosamine-1-phosphate transferase
VLILGGVAHATNLIYGLNGLAMGVCMLNAARLAFLANALGDNSNPEYQYSAYVFNYGIVCVQFPIWKNFPSGCRGIHLGARIDLVVDLACCAES